MISSMLAGFAGLAVIYACGLIGLVAFIGFSKSILVGIKPFLVIDILKVLLVSAIVPHFWRSANKHH